MLRNVWFYFWLALTTPIFTVIAWLFSWEDSGRGATWCAKYWSAILLWSAGVEIEVDFSAIPENDEPLIFMCNHQSQLDILVLYNRLNRFKPLFVAKESLFHFPVFGVAMRSAHHIPIDRSNRRKAMKSIQMAVEAVERGRNIIIYPEGSRTTDPETMLPFKIGGVVMALKCRRPVVPIVMTGTYEILPKGKLGFPPGKKLVRARALPPVDVQANYTLKDRERFKDDLFALMSDAYTELRHG